MCRILIALIAAAWLPQFVPAESTSVEPISIGDFALIDQQGVFHQLSRYSNRKAVLLFVDGSEDGATQDGGTQDGGTLAILRELRDAYDEQTIKILMINADASSTRDSIRDAADARGIDFQILHDKTQLVAESLGIERIGEALLIDPAELQLIYRGPADQRLVELLRSVVGDEPVEFLAREVDGREIAFPVRQCDQQDSISYQTDIAPILTRRCTGCHQDGGIAPFAMASHMDVQGWSEMIRETILTKRMPPGQIDPEVGELVDVHHITPEEQTTLIHWIDAGAEMSGEEDPLAELVAPTDLWQLGEPDLIVDWPAVDVPATGVIDYFTNTAEIDGLNEDRWIRAFEVCVGDKSVLHHCMISAQAMGEDGKSPMRGSLMGFYVPGKPWTMYHDDVGYLLEKGSRLRLQLHYTTTGKATVDRTKIGFHFHDTEPRMAIRQGLVSNFGFVIPPNTENHPVTATYTVSEDSYLFKLSPHMHNRGSYVDYSLKYPDGRTEKLISVPNYQFNWQMGYALKEPRFMPQGTMIISTGGWNNSVTNRANPDPDDEVRYGDQTWEEMFNSWMSIAKAP